MRVAFVADRFYSELAGTENQLGKLIRGLSGRFEIDLVVLRDSEWLRTQAQLPCSTRIIQVDDFKRPYTYRNLHRLVRHLRALQPDIVHTFFPVANVVGVLCARAAGVGCIVSSRRDYGEWMSRRYLWATRFANRFIQGVVTNSHEVKRLTQRAEGLPGERIAVIYNGITLERFRDLSPNAHLKARLGIGPDQRVVGLIANYRPMKRHETFIQAARDIIQRRADVDFLLVGQDAVPGQPKQAMQNHVARLGIGHRVHFAHASGDITDYLSILDVGVNCSEGEGLSNAVMEYMAAGVPCVVSESGGNPDLISDGVTGYTFPLGNHLVLAEKISEALDNRPVRESLAANAQEKVRREMSLEAMLDHFERYYRTIVTEDRRSASNTGEAKERP